MIDEKQQDFEFQIWELENKVNAAELHLKKFKEENAYFADPKKRAKGTDTMFYEQNLAEWKRRLDISIKQFEQEYGREYDRKKVTFPWDAEEGDN